MPTNFKDHKDHPEREADELYLGNFNQDGFHNHIGWKTKRLGNIAYDITGTELKQSKDRISRALDAVIFPAFVKRSEIEQALQKETMKESPYKSTISALTKFLAQQPPGHD